MKLFLIIATLFLLTLAILATVDEWDRRIFYGSIFLCASSFIWLVKKFVEDDKRQWK